MSLAYNTGKYVYVYFLYIIYVFVCVCMYIRTKIHNDGNYAHAHV